MLLKAAKTFGNCVVFLSRTIFAREVRIFVGRIGGRRFHVVASRRISLSKLYVLRHASRFHWYHHRRADMLHAAALRYELLRLDKFLLVTTAVRPHDSAAITQDRKGRPAVKKRGKHGRHAAFRQTQARCLVALAVGQVFAGIHSCSHKDGPKRKDGAHKLRNHEEQELAGL